MQDPAEHALVCKSIRDCLGGCFEWDEKAAARLRSDRELDGLTPRFIRQAVRDHVHESGDHVVVQVVEIRERWRDRYRFYYKVILPVEDFPLGIFVEMRLTGADDPEFPEVTVVNAHLQLSR